MEYNTLTQDQYNELVGDLIKPTESLHTHSQDIGDGRATIGYGYTFNRDNNVGLWREVEEGIREAIEMHLAGVREDGQLVPPPSSAVEYVDIAA